MINIPQVKEFLSNQPTHTAEYIQFGIKAKGIIQEMLIEIEGKRYNKKCFNEQPAIVRWNEPELIENPQWSEG